MEEFKDRKRNIYHVLTWILVGFILFSQLLMKLPIIQMLALGLLIAIQYQTKSLTKLTLGIVSVLYIVIVVFWGLGA